MSFEKIMLISAKPQKLLMPLTGRACLGVSFKHGDREMAKDAELDGAPMKGGRTNRICMVLPVGFSIVALALVVGNVAAGVPPQADEGAAAHLFQLLIVAQFPLAVLFMATADWTRSARPLLVLLVQALAGAAALGALYWAGY